MDRLDHYAVLFFGLIAIVLAVWALVDILIVLG